MSHKASENDAKAPTYPVPQKHIVSIEHPCIVKNFSNGLKSLGGEHQLKHVFEHEIGDSEKSSKGQRFHEPVAAVSLRPNNMLAKKLASAAAETNNVLVRVTVPKRTGRKRKRGSDEPFTESLPADSRSDSITASDLLQRLRDNADRYTVQAVGMIEDTHRFRDLPDLQIRAEEVPIMRNLKDYALAPNYNKLKDFRVDLNPGSNGITSFPGPPSFVPHQPFRYEFQQPPHESSNAQSKKSGPSALIRFGMSLGTEGVPQGPPQDLPEPKGEILPKALDALKGLLEERPIVTISSASNILNQPTRNISAALPYVGYYPNSGPWREAIVKYGVDPRSDPKYRFYQTLVFRVDQRRRYTAGKEAQPSSNEAHLFNGKTLEEPRPLWQLCDITDPVLMDLVNSSEARRECESDRLGWYHNGTLAKIRVIMRDKLLHIMKGRALWPGQDYKAIAMLPNTISAPTRRQFDFLFPDHHLKVLARNVEKEANDRRTPAGVFKRRFPLIEHATNQDMDSVTGAGEDDEAGRGKSSSNGAEVYEGLDDRAEHERATISDREDDDGSEESQDE